VIFEGGVVGFDDDDELLQLRPLLPQNAGTAVN
jgi:hypothetical protein